MPDWIIKYWVEWAFGAVLAIIGFLIKRLYGRVKKEREAREHQAEIVGKLRERNFGSDARSPSSMAAASVSVRYPSFRAPPE